MFNFSKKQIIILLTLFVMIPSLSTAKEKYAGSTGQDCLVCHIEEGGPLTETGKDFQASGYKWPPTMKYRPILPLAKSIRFLVGFLHLLTAFLWFGTILYVHLILKPAYASRGLPKGEVLVGLVSMLVIAVTGTLLTLSRINAFDHLTTTSWGQLLMIKIILFSIMVITAMIAVFFIGPRLKKAIKGTGTLPGNGIFDALTLSGFTGKGGTPALIAYQEKVYDVTVSKRWLGGSHYKRHSAGNDLTSALKQAPHGVDKLEDFKVVGTYDPTIPAPKTTHQKVFFFFAYLNLVLVFTIIFVIALMKWA